MGGLIGLVIFVLNVIAMIDALKSSLEAGKKVLWIGLILFLPVLGLILYYLLGRKKSA